MKIDLVFLLLGSIINICEAKKTFKKKYRSTKKKHRAIIPVAGTAVPPNEIQLDTVKVLGNATPNPAALTAVIPAWQGQADGKHPR